MTRYFVHRDTSYSYATEIGLKKFVLVLSYPHGSHFKVYKFKVEVIGECMLPGREKNKKVNSLF